MNPQYESIARIHAIDNEASLVTQDQRAAEKQLAELAEKTTTSAEMLKKSRNDMTYNESELRRLYKKLDELDERRNERNSRLLTAKNDSDHRSAKRDLDNVDREIRDFQRRADEVESRIEGSKNIFRKARTSLQDAEQASATETQKAQEAREASAGKLQELDKIRDTYLDQLEDRTVQHYDRVSLMTRNPNGPICYVEGSVCGNCHIGLSPQILNNVHRGKSIEFCPNCLHILLNHNV